MIFSVLILVSLGCKKNKLSRAEKDDITIRAYIDDHNLTAVPTGSGLYIVTSNEGNGSACTSASTVTVAYKGYFDNGEVFDQSSASGVTFPLQNVIAGWKEGIPYFKEGGNGMLLIPSGLAYGPSGSGSIPGNTVLIFDVNLIDVQ